MSSFVVSARKYRPNRFDDVLGQEHISQTLKNALQTDHLAHAFLFCGPRGVGKTTCARILAKTINCTDLDDQYNPCNKCSSCNSFNDNASFNIIELDAASNNGVDHIRALIEQVRFAPQQGLYKVFIIDEVHMLSQQAFNAFLKTLEEPPKHAIFILATTEKHKILPTILSRCQLFDFKRIQIKDIVKQLQIICATEGITAEEEALHVIAQKADGAMRDALSIFDRIVSFSGKELKYQDVIGNLNVLDYDYYFKTSDAMLSQDASAVFLLLDEIMNKGFEPETYLNGLGDHIRSLLLCKDPATVALLELTDDIKLRYKDTASLFDSNYLMNGLAIINHFDINSRTVRNKRLHSEMSLLKLVYLNQLKFGLAPSSTESQEKKTPDLSKNELSVSEPIIQTPAEESILRQPTPKTDSDYIRTVPNSSVATILSLADLEAQAIAKIKSDSPAKEVTEDELISIWEGQILKITSPSVKAALSGIKVRLENQLIVATVGTTFGKEILLQEKDLMPAIRTHFSRSDLNLEIEIDTSLAPVIVQKAKPLSGKEKYDKLVEVNPQVDELRKRFHLRIEE